jgi:hypothetical protein
MGAIKEHYHDEIEKGQREANVKKPHVQNLKINRNDPCGCGSGKKFKHCCEIRIRLGLQKRVIDARAKQNRKR